MIHHISVPLFHTAGNIPRRQHRFDVASAEHKLIKPDVVVAPACGLLRTGNRSFKRQAGIGTFEIQYTHGSPKIHPAAHAGNKMPVPIQHGFLYGIFKLSAKGMVGKTVPGCRKRHFFRTMPGEATGYRAIHSAPALHTIPYVRAGDREFR